MWARSNCQTNASPRAFETLSVVESPVCEKKTLRSTDRILKDVQFELRSRYSRLLQNLPFRSGLNRIGAISHWQEAINKITSFLWKFGSKTPIINIAGLRAGFPSLMIAAWRVCLRHVVFRRHRVAPGAEFAIWTYSCRACMAANNDNPITSGPRNEH